MLPILSSLLPSPPPFTHGKSSLQDRERFWCGKGFLLSQGSPDPTQSRTWEPWIECFALNNAFTLRLDSTRDAQKCSKPGPTCPSSQRLSCSTVLTAMTRTSCLNKALRHISIGRTHQQARTHPTGAAGVPRGPMHRIAPIQSSALTPKQPRLPLALLSWPGYGSGTEECKAA